MKKTFLFGKIAYFGGPMRTFPVHVTMELRREGDKEIPIVDKATGDRKVTCRTPAYLELSIAGTIYYPGRRDIACSGQCLNDIAEFRDQLSFPERFDEIYALWKKWHLNGLHAGTPEQDAAVDEWLAAGNKYDYTAACEMLKEKGLYEVNYTGLSTSRRYENEPYTYGSGWLVRELPDDVLHQVHRLFKTPQMEVTI